MVGRDQTTNEGVQCKHNLVRETGGHKYRLTCTNNEHCYLLSVLPQSVEHGFSDKHAINMIQLGICFIWIRSSF